MRCCNACKTPYVCGNKECACHAFQLRTDNLKGSLPHADPTGNTAVCNIMNKRKQYRRNRRKK